MAMIAMRLPVLVVLAACSRAPADDVPQVKPMAATVVGHPNGYSPPCRSFTATFVATINLLLVRLVRPSQSVDQWLLEPPCGD